MPFDRIDAEYQLSGDLAVSVAGGQQSEYLGFAGGKPVWLPVTAARPRLET